ncbi:NnrU family protein [Sphingomonas psychrotolerans]|uniref:NnrU family protein n=1 Tax=Sphingomonas psychrotolerans TaxID=1327635 RepID=A0ABU3N6D6_9SPHN|nr:NnrU family protein [Sphingomonas psychrotolerans]MDT8759031.1 NnrU family protein [Sphingomonas psychrotolerans]
MESLIAASVAFVGLHFLLSHPLRRPLTGAIGPRGFLALYVVSALASFAWMVLAFRAIPPEPLWWAMGDLGWTVASVVMLVAAILFVGSLFGNPAFPDPTGSGGHEAIGKASGVYAVTRHPMMWGFALWALVHFAVYPTDANAVLTAAILILALVGAALQDVKKTAAMPAWTDWKARTSYWPFAAILGGRARWSLDARALLLGTLLWLAASWAHVPLGGVLAAGIWRWIG